MNSKPHQARKRFGQNFLQDGRIIDRLINLIGPQPDDAMVEIGPGQGALTKPLLNKLNALHAVEIDRDLHRILQQVFADKNLILHEADALKFDFTELVNDRPLRVVGNLPYNISTPLIFHLLQFQQQIKDMHFMLQLEVVDRLVASHGSKTYGRATVISQYFCQIDKCFLVPPEAFSPKPKVMSAIVKLTPRPFSEKVDDEALFIKVVKISFSQRRKTLKNNLKQILDADQLALLEFDLTLRPEQLSVENYVKLTNSINKIVTQ